MKGDKSTKVGKRPKKATPRPQRSVATKPKGRAIMMKGGNRAYQNNGKPA